MPAPKLVNHVRFTLNISAEAYLSYYKGQARQVVVRQNGKTIAFPANRLSAFVTKNGIHGNFELSYNSDNKFVSINRID